MSNDNSLNPEKGRAFQSLCAELLYQHFGVRFVLDHAIPIGNPPKEHRFDLVSKDLRYVGEAKNYSWTEAGNMPSAKMAFLNEAVLFLSLTSAAVKRFIVMRKATHPRRQETLASYYYRTYVHLLDGISILEVDTVAKTLKAIGNAR